MPRVGEISAGFKKHKAPFRREAHGNPFEQGLFLQLKCDYNIVTLKTFSARSNREKSRFLNKGDHL
jgi:hypothetical protein